MTEKDANKDKLKGLETSSMDTPFSEINALSITQLPTDSSWIKKRTIKGRDLSYVSGDLVIRVLNKAFRNRWSFEVKETRIVDSVDRVYRDKRTGTETATPQNPVVQTLGSLTVPGWGVREQWGAQPVLGGQDVQEHAFKSSATDALKKCASMFGITLDLYGTEGMVELMISPEDYLRNDEESFEKLKEKLMNKSQEENKPVAEPDLVGLEQTNETKDTIEDWESAIAPADIAPAEPAPTINQQPAEVPYQQKAPAAQETTQKTFQEAVAKPSPWKTQDIVDMKRIKEHLKLPNNEDLDVYVKQFLKNEDGSMLRHITPENVRDFITYMEINHLN